MRVQVAYADAAREAVAEVDVASGAALDAAVAASGLVERLGLDPAGLGYAIHGQRATPATPLREGDRVELLRPLLADPKAARRVRAQENPLPPAAPKPKKRYRGPLDGCL